MTFFVIPAYAEEWCRDAPFTERRMQIQGFQGLTGYRIRSGMTFRKMWDSWV
jgi:hypothetical protein